MDTMTPRHILRGLFAVIGMGLLITLVILMSALVGQNAARDRQDRQDSCRATYAATDPAYYLCVDGQ